MTISESVPIGFNVDPHEWISYDFYRIRPTKKKFSSKIWWTMIEQPTAETNVL